MSATGGKYDVGSGSGRNGESPHTESRKSKRLVRMALILGSLAVIAIAILLRLLIIGREPVNSDEAVVGLMAHEILRGHFFAFYWGQNYGGVEPYIVAFAFLIFGQSSWTLGLVPVFLDFVAAFLLFRIGKRFFAPRVALGASLLFLVWPEVYVWQSTIEYGFRFIALDIGLMMVLLVLKIIEANGSGSNSAVRHAATGNLPSEGLPDASPSISKRRFFSKKNFDYLLLGLLSGLGWWATPEIAYFAIPLALLIIYSLLRKKLRVSFSQLGLFILGIAVGAAPWLYDNVGHGFPSLNANSQANSPFTEHFRVFLSHVLPMVLDLRFIASGNWLWKKDFDLAVYALLLLIFFVYLLISIKEKKNFFLIMFLLLFPLEYAYSPFTWYWQDGRYAIYLAPFLALYLVASVESLLLWLSARLKRLGRSGVSPDSPDKMADNVKSGYVLPAGRTQKISTWATVAVVATGLAFTLATAANVAPFVPNQSILGRSSWLSFESNPNNWLEPTVAVLREHHIQNAFAGYWLAYALTFTGNGSLTVSPTLFIRYDQYEADVENASKVAWIFPNPTSFAFLESEVGTYALYPGCIGGYRKKAVPGFGLSGCLDAGEMESYLNKIHDGYRVFSMGGLLAVVPDREVSLAVLYKAEHIF